MFSLNPLNQLLVAVLVIVVGLLAYVYFHYIKSGDPLPKEDKDWKKYRDEVLNPHLQADKEWAEKVATEGKVRAYERDEELKVYFKKMWNDGGNWLQLIIECFKNIGKIIHWTEYRWYYIGAFVILFFMVLHYVFGV